MGWPGAARRPRTLDLLSGASAFGDCRWRRDEHAAGQHHHDLGRADRRADRHDRRDQAWHLARPGAVRRRHADGVGADVLGRALPDPDFRGLARLAAELGLSVRVRGRRHRQPALPDPAEPHPCGPERRADPAPDARQYARRLARGLCAHRARQGHSPMASRAPAHPAQRAADGRRRRSVSRLRRCCRKRS